jgi:hypothetical protein
LKLDLYLYSVKIQTNIKRNSVEKYTKKSQIFKNIFLKVLFLDWAGPSSVILGWANAFQLQKHKANNGE